MPAKTINPVNTFKVFECCVHPATRPEDLHHIMLGQFWQHRPDFAVKIDAFQIEQSTTVVYTSRVDHFERRDPICALDVTILDDAKALYFKMLFSDM